MKSRHLFSTLAILLFATQSAVADPMEIVISGRVLSVKDNKTKESFVLESHKVRVESKIFLEVRGHNDGTLRNWLDEKLPRRLQAYFEREELESGLITRFRDLPFRLQPGSTQCARDYQPEFRVCKAEYAVSKSNAVDVPPGVGGKQSLTIQIVAPTEVGIPLKIARTRPKVYNVLTGKPQLSMHRFTGLPQH